MTVFRRELSGKLVRHIRKKIRTSLHGLRPTAVYGRLIGPRVLINSIPKAGTHLLETALEHYSLLRNAGRRTISSWEEPNEATLNTLRTVGKGQFLNGHLCAHSSLFEIVRGESIKVLFVIRDPRDVVVSHFKYVTGMDRTHWAHEHYAKLETDHDRLMASIVGVADIKPSIGEVLRRFQPWMDLDEVLVCRFEDLIGPSGGGDEQRQHNILARISAHIGISMSDKELSYISGRVFSSKSSTFRRGEAGGWTRYFEEDHIRAFKRVAGKELIAYGYAEDDEW